MSQLLYIDVFSSFKDKYRHTNGAVVGGFHILTVDMKQWSRFSSEKRTPSLMKTALALRMKEKNRLMWM